jgi:cytochrome c-type biogenesis protein CcmE
MKLKHQRLFLISGALLGLGIAASLTLTALQDSLVFFYTPSDLLHKTIPCKQRIRVGGLVAVDSFQQQGESIKFSLTDHQKTLHVTYHGLLPDLFREGQGAVIEGYLLNSSHFQAETVFAKHDEKYMPQEVADQLKQRGFSHHDQ